MGIVERGDRAGRGEIRVFPTIGFAKSGRRVVVTE